MRFLKFTLFLVLLVSMAAPLLAAGKYGDAVLKKGEMVIMREGQRLKFQEANQQVTVNENDLIRVRRNSEVELRSREKATVTLGSNAVFHVKPWQAKGSSGFARMLFGRFRASISGLVGGERFNVKTSTATIGVKGTEFRSAVASQGSTVLIVEESDVEITASPTKTVSPGFMSVVVMGGKGATDPVQVPPALVAAFGTDNLDAPLPNGLFGKDLPAESALIRAGIINQNDVDKSKQDEGSEPEVEGDSEEPDFTAPTGTEINNRNKGRINLQFAP